MIKWGSTVCYTIKWGNTVCSQVKWGNTIVYPDTNYVNGMFSFPFNSGLVEANNNSTNLVFTKNNVSPSQITLPSNKCFKTTNSITTNSSNPLNNWYRITYYLYTVMSESTVSPGKYVSVEKTLGGFYAGSTLLKELDKYKSLGNNIYQCWNYSKYQYYGNDYIYICFSIQWTGSGSSAYKNFKIALLNIESSNADTNPYT